MNQEVSFDVHTFCVAQRTTKLQAKVKDLWKRIYMRIEAGDWPAHIAKQFGMHRSTIYSVKKLYEETGNFSQRPSSGRPRSVRTKAMIAAVKAKIDKNPHQNICKMARDMNVDKVAVSRAVQVDLSMKLRAVMKVQGLTAKQRKNRKEKCRVLLNKLKKGNSKIHVFSDEKIFTVDAICMSRTNRYITKKPKDVSPAIRYMRRTKHPASTMMLGVVGLDGKAFPALNATYGQGNWVWTQDGTLSHLQTYTGIPAEEVRVQWVLVQVDLACQFAEPKPIGLLRVCLF